MRIFSNAYAACLSRLPVAVVASYHVCEVHNIHVNGSNIAASARLPLRNTSQRARNGPRFVSSERRGRSFPSWKGISAWMLLLRMSMSRYV